jgi:hypothetical protein
MERAGAHTPDGFEDDLVRMRDGIRVSGDTAVVARGARNRAQVVDERREILDPLADIGVVRVEGRVAEDVTES